MSNWDISLYKFYKHETNRMLEMVTFNTKETKNLLVPCTA